MMEFLEHSGHWLNISVFLVGLTVAVVRAFRGRKRRKAQGSAGEEATPSVPAPPASTLRSLKVVRALCRDFAADYLRILCLREEWGHPETEEALLELCWEYAEIFCGHKPSYPPAAGWTGAALGEFLDRDINGENLCSWEELSEGGEDWETIGMWWAERSLKRYFLREGQEFKESLLALLEGRITPAEHQTFIASQCAWMEANLLGLPGQRPPQHF